MNSLCVSATHLYKNFYHPVYNHERFLLSLQNLRILQMELQLIVYDNSEI